ncbi:MAG: ComEC/Rec2 family competence protein [Bacteroidales bacterium]|nr:ComEC/Rec2 family competence protein [Bacteroidales bacterium]
MVVEKDIVAISIPFSAGVVTAALLPPGSDALWAVAGGTCLAAGALLFSLSGRGNRSACIFALFYVLGVFCSASGALLPPLRQATPEPAGRALDALLRAIGQAGFPHESTAQLLEALLAGRREMLDRQTVETFRAAGASHILALSGLHLGILYGILQKALSPLGRGRIALPLRSAAAILAAAFYLAMTGAGASLVRAFLFILFNETSRLLPGRKRTPLGVFCAALTVQLAVSPAVIRTLGFQLSYLAMLGICLLFPRLDTWYPQSPRWDPLRRIWSATALTLSCQAFTAPLVWIRFHTFPKYFLLTNLGALPLTEGFLLCSLPALLPGCPEGIKKLADTLGQNLLGFLETVASIP